MVSDLDVDVLAGTPFMATNDISICPAMQQITIKGTSVTYYSPTSSDSHHHHVRRTQAHLLRAPAVASVIWPGEYLEMSIPKELENAHLKLHNRICCDANISIISKHSWGSSVETIGQIINIY